MNELNRALEREMNSMAALKGDLVGVENLLEERPVDTNNLIETMEQREFQINQL